MLLTTFLILICFYNEIGVEKYIGTKDISVMLLSIILYLIKVK